MRIAHEHATREVPVARPDQSAGDVRAMLLGETFEAVETIVVVDRETLVGVVPTVRVLAADAATRLDSLLDDDQPVVAPGDDQQAVLAKLVASGEPSIAVVGDQHQFLGLTPAARMLPVLLDEHHEDLARLGGFAAGTRRARVAADESIGRRLQHRLPWLIVGLLGAMASAGLVGAFEDQLDKKVLLAFFVPAVVYMADAVGTQTEAVLIRGLSVGVTVREVIWRELLTGLTVGVLVGAVFLPFAAFVWGDTRVAIAVALALLASCSIATVVAVALPWLFQRLGKDPAFGSGPLATVIQDLLSLAVYFAIAIPIAL